MAGISSDNREPEGASTMAEEDPPVPRTGINATTSRNNEPQVLPLDVLQNELGAFGMYQFVLLLIITICKIPLAFNQLAIVYISPKTTYTCGSETSKRSSTKKAVCPCANPIYDKSTFPKTMITEYGLICERRWLEDLHQGLFQFGTLTGSLAFGMISDRFGRRKTMLLAIMVQIFGGFGSAFIKNFWVFTMLRFLVGFSSGGIIVASFVILMEYVGSACRETITLVLMTTFVAGVLLLPVISYFARSYDTFLLSLGIINCIQLSYFWILPETARWYLTQKKTEKAIAMFEKVRKRNKKPDVDVRQRIEEHILSVSGHTQKPGTLCDVFQRSNLRKHMLAMGYNWFTSSFCYYGLSQYMGKLSGNVFLNSALSGFVTLIGLIVGIPITKRFGRKVILIGSNVLAAVCIFATLVLPEGALVVIFACIGVSANFYVFAVEFLYCAELFPTVVRSAVMGFTSMLARIGSIAAPFVVGLDHKSVLIPKFIFGGTPLLAALAALLLPETKGLGLVSTLEEGEAIGKKNKP